MDEHHQRTPTLELDQILLIEQHQRGAAKRNYDARIGERLPVQQLVRGCPYPFTAEIASRNVV
jgi:hypothetical protein